MKRLVAGALFRADEVLLVRRTASQNWYPSMWDLPGGEIENAETEHEALIRELREETGVVVSQIVTPAIGRLKGCGQDQVSVELSVWLVHSWHGKPTNNEPHKHDEVRWTALSALATLDLAHPEYADLLARAQSKSQCRVTERVCDA